MSDFPSIALQSTLSTEAILFGVFGFLYSVYGTYSAQANPGRATIVKKLRVFCRVIAVFITLNAILTVFSLYLINLSTLYNIILAIGLAATMIAISLMSIIWSFSYLD